MSITTEKSKIITCILPKGRGLELIKILKEEKEITSAFFSNARGTGMVRIVGKLGWGKTMEKDVVYVVTPSRRGDEIFEFIYHRMEIEKAHGGFIYMGKLKHSVPFLLPEISENQDATLTPPQ